MHRLAILTICMVTTVVLLAGCVSAGTSVPANEREVIELYLPPVKYSNE